MHVYAMSWEVFKGLKFKIAVALVSLRDVVRVIPFPEVTGSLLIPSHIALGMLVRPGMTSVITQVKVNSDPATMLPD